MARSLRDKTSIDGVRRVQSYISKGRGITKTFLRERWGRFRGRQGIRVSRADSACCWWWRRCSCENRFEQFTVERSPGAPF